MHKIRIATLNCQSIKNKCHEINKFIIKNSLDIVCFTETWSQKNDIYHNYPNKYQLIRQDRASKGGIAILLNRAIKVQQTRFMKKEETLHLKVLVNNESFNIIVSYLYPKSNTTYEHLDDLLNYSSSKTNILGDFNALHSLWYCADANKRENY
jgi:exonuclease III